MDAGELRLLGDVAEGPQLDRERVQRRSSLFEARAAGGCSGLPSLADSAGKAVQVPETVVRPEAVRDRELAGAHQEARGAGPPF